MSLVQWLMVIAGGFFALLWLACTVFVIWFIVRIARRVL